MKISQKAISLALILSMLFGLIGNAYALEANTDEELPTEDQQEMRVEDVKVDGIFDFSEEALESVENYVNADENGFFYVGDENALRSVLSDDEYRLVLEQIEITNAEIMVAAASDGTGTESNPYILSENSAYNTNATGASSTWFKISGIGGAADFIVTTSVSATVTIYKKNLIGKTQIATASGKNINKVISASDINNNGNNYLINVNVSSAMTSKITVKQHKDTTTTYYTGGTVWTPYNKSAIPNTYVLTKKMWYLKAADIPDLVDMVTHDKYLQTCEDFANGLLTVAGVASALGLDGHAGKVVGVALALIGGSSPFAFRQHILDQIDVAGGRSGDRYTKNVYMMQVFDVNSAITFTYVYTWSGSTISGAPGYTGTFTAP